MQKRYYKSAFWFMTCLMLCEFPPFTAPTFLTEHAVTEDDLREDGVVLQNSSQHAAGVCGDALPAQVQSAAARRRSRVVQLRQHRFLSVYSSLLTQPQVRPPEILHDRHLSLACRGNKTYNRQRGQYGWK